MKGCRKIFECKITVEGVQLPIATIVKPFIEDGYEVIEKPLEFGSHSNCTKAEIEVYRIIEPIN